MRRVGHLASCILALLLAPVVPAQPFFPGPVGGPDVEVRAVPGVLPAQSRVTFFMAIHNDGPGNITDVMVDIRPAPGNDIVVLGTLLRDLDTVEEDESGLLAVRLATGEQTGGAGVIVRVAYFDEAGAPFNLTQEVSLQIGPPPTNFLQVDYVPQTLVSGEDARLRFVVTNPTGDTFRQLDLDLLTSADETLEEGLPLTLDRGGNELTPGAEGTPILRGARLRAGDRIEVSAPVRVGQDPGDLESFRVRARYTLEGYQREETFTFGARLQGDVVLRVLEAREERVGGRMEVTGTLVNVGTGTAWNPQVRIPRGASYATTPYLLVSDLEPNEPVAFRIETEPIEAAETGPDVPLLEVEWNDDKGRVRQERVASAVTPAPEEATAPTWDTYARSPWAQGLALLALVLLGGAGVKKLIQKRREEED